MKQHRYVKVDGMYGGTGIRDSVTGGFLSLESLHLTAELVEDFKAWLQCYEEAHFAGYSEAESVAELDRQGMSLCLRLRNEMPDSKIEYFSSGLMTRLDKPGG